MLSVSIKTEIQYLCFCNFLESDCVKEKKLMSLLF